MNETTEIEKIDIHQRIDELEAAMVEGFPIIDAPLSHIFTPGLYTREIFMQRDSLWVSKLHNTTHPFVISKGVAHVKINDGEWERLEAPYTGVTYPGTRRILYIEEDCIFTTFHATNIAPENNSEDAILKAVEKIEEVIIEKHVNPLLENIINNDKTLSNV